MFDATAVTEAFRKVLEEPGYRHNALRLRCAARSQGGRRLAVQTIENAFLHAHVNDVDEAAAKEQLANDYATADTIEKCAKRRRMSHLIDEYHS